MMDTPQGPAASSRRPSPVPRMPSDRSRHGPAWSSEQYEREARDEEARQAAATTHLHDAIRNGDATVLADLLRDGTADTTARDAKGRTALHIAAKMGRPDMVDLLLARKEVDVDAADRHRSTPLHLAAMHGRADCVERLLRRGASAEAVDDRGHLPRYYAAASPQVARLFDNPPKVVTARQIRGTNRSAEPQATPAFDDGRGGVSYSIPENFASASATSAPVPQGMHRALCEAFGGSFWERGSDVRWRSASVWDLVYADGAEAQTRRAARTKWFHLSCVSETWTKDLARNICAAGAGSADRSRAVRDFIGRVFRSVDAEGPVRKRHFIVRH